MQLRSVRAILMSRDDMSPEEVDSAFEDFADEVRMMADDEGVDPAFCDIEGMFSAYFDLEPDYLFDPELQRLLIRKGLL